MVHYIYAKPLFSMFLFALFCIGAYGFLNAVLKDKKWLKILSLIGLILSVLAVLYITLFSRGGGEHPIILKPFYSFEAAKIQPEIYRSVFMNWFLYVPFGIFLPYVLFKKHKWLNILIAFLMGFTLSSLVEYLQYTLSLGRSETDDVIFNTLGAVTGALGYLLCEYLVRKETKMKEDFGDLQNLILSLCALGLFGKEKDIDLGNKEGEILQEANRQTVYPLVCTALKNITDGEQTSTEVFLQRIAENMQVNFDHSSVHSLLSGNGIDYVAFKGVASAKYYPDPILRTMGDTDILINRQDIKKVDLLLKNIGYTTTDDIEKEKGHVAYGKKEGNRVSRLEVHFTLGGIPEGKKEIFEKYLSDLISTSVSLNTPCGVCRVPDKFHHGLILLLHTATHLINEGVGLRHLCDWAVFVNTVSDKEMTETFQKPLKELGLFEFARYLTAVSVEFLGAEPKNFVGEVDKGYLEDLISDILAGGNFGTKDADRYTQIKYISNRNDRTIDNKNPVSQVFFTLKEKTKRNVKFVEKHPLLLPFGMVYTLFNYLFLVVTKKRKGDSLKTLSDAKHRKDIYSEFKLFL